MADPTEERRPRILDLFSGTSEPTVREAEPINDEDLAFHKRNASPYGTLGRTIARLEEAESENNRLRALLDRTNLEDIKWDKADEERRLHVALRALRSGDLKLAGTVLYGTQSAIVQEFHRRKAGAPQR